MKIKAEINGWSKILDVPNDCILRGYVEIALFPPLDSIVPSSEKESNNSTVKTVLLNYVGADNNLSVFRYLIIKQIKGLFT